MAVLSQGMMQRAQQPVEERNFTPLLVLVLGFGAVLSIVFFRGPFGSDDTVYFYRALDVSSGDWRSYDYIGSLRYGMNLPTGALFWLFGPSYVAGTLYPLFLFLGQAALLAVLVRGALGARAAFLAALLMVTLPLGILSGTAFHVDMPLAFTMTLSFALFWWAEQRNSTLLYILFGLAAGASYWMKEATIVYLILFLPYVLYRRRLRWGYVWAAAAAVAMFAANCLLMWVIAGDPLHVLNVMQGAVERGYIAQRREDNPLYYFRYLFIEIHHTGLLGFLTAGAIIVFLVKRRTLSSAESGFIYYVLFWFLGLLALFSLMPISFEPLIFVAKQTNYMNMFVAPMAILSGWFIARLMVPVRWIAVAAAVAVAVLFTGLKQQDFRAFTANGRVLAALAQDNPGDLYFGTVSNFNIARLLDRTPDEQPPIRTLAQLEMLDGESGTVYAILDRQTLGWSARDPDVPTVPACWVEGTTLVPIGHGAVAHLLPLLTWAISPFAGTPLDWIADRLSALANPASAVVYAVPADDPWCEG